MRNPAFVIAVGVAAIAIAGCAGARSVTAPSAVQSVAMPALVNANAFMQAHTQLSSAFKIQSGPPMAQSSATATPMTTTRAPQSQIVGLADWTQIPGGAQYVAASPDGTIWAISNIYLNQQGNWIYHYVNGSWSLVGNGNAVRVAIGPDGTAYALQGAGQVYV